MGTRNKSYNALQQVTLAAGAKVTKAVTGNKFAVKESNGVFQVGFDDEKPFDMEVGIGFMLEPGDTFSKLVFVNPTNNQITVKFYAGTVRINDARLNTLIERFAAVSSKVFPTKINPIDKTLAAGEALVLAGTVGGLQVKQTIITNRDAALSLDLCDGNGLLFDELFPRSKWTAETSATMIVLNSNGAPVKMRACQIVYTA